LLKNNNNNNNNCGFFIIIGNSIYHTLYHFSKLALINSNSKFGSQFPFPCFHFPKQKLESEEKSQIIEVLNRSRSKNPKTKTKLVTKECTVSIFYEQLLETVSGCWKNEICDFAIVSMFGVCEIF
jgi:hypothetical protein